MPSNIYDTNMIQPKFPPIHPLPTPIYTPSWGDTPARVLRQSNVEHAPNKTMMSEKMDKFQFSLAFPFLKFQYLKLQKKFLDPKKYFLGPHVILSMGQISCKGVCWCHVKNGSCYSLNFNPQKKPNFGPRKNDWTEGE